MVRHPQIAPLAQAFHEHSLPEALWTSQAGDELQRDLSFFLRFNRDLDENARPSRLNEAYLESKIEALDRHYPVASEIDAHTRVRLHELLLLCAANYANNCEYRAVGDLMFNPRYTLVHIRGQHVPVVKKRHGTLTEQFKDRAETGAGVVMWLKNQTVLEVIKQPLIRESYSALESSGLVNEGYLASARQREVHIAELSAFLCSAGFKDRVDLEKWMRRAHPEDRKKMKSRMLGLDWGTYSELGSLITDTVVQILQSPFFGRNRRIEGVAREMNSLWHGRRLGFCVEEGGRIH